MNEETTSKLVNESNLYGRAANLGLNIMLGTDQSVTQSRQRAAIQVSNIRNDPSGSFDLIVALQGHASQKCSRNRSAV